MMKIYKYIIVVIILSTLVNAQGILGTQHDFKNEFSINWNIPEEVCIACHISNNESQSKVVQQPLWDHKPLENNFVPYKNIANLSEDNEINITSKLCLSCHDGTVAFDNYSGNNKIRTAKISFSHIAKDLPREHPISFKYDSVSSEINSGLHDHIATNSGLGGTINQDLLFNGKLECASCHDVHNLDGFTKLLRIDNTDSRLCLTCHDK